MQCGPTACAANSMTSGLSFPITASAVTLVCFRANMVANWISASRFIPAGWRWSLFAGIGADIDAALKDAFDVTCEQWNIAGTTRQMTLGNVVFRGNTPADPVPWFPQFETALKSLALPGGTHWVRLYYATWDSQTMIHEALLDNETWPELQEAMACFCWPPTEHFCSARLFLVIQGGAGFAEACTAICRAGGHGSIDEMITMGATPRQATLLYSFLTLAFGRKIIEGPGVNTSGDFLLCEPDGRRTGRTLASEPLFLQAATLAQSHSQLSKDQFISIAMQSSEVRAVNEALNNGSRAVDLVLSSPVIFLPE